MRISRLWCHTCQDETLHASVKCVRCGTAFVVAALVPRLADTFGSSRHNQRCKGGKSSKLNPRRAVTSS